MHSMVLSLHQTTIIIISIIIIRIVIGCPRSRSALHAKLASKTANSLIFHVIIALNSENLPVGIGGVDENQCTCQREDA